MTLAAEVGLYVPIVLVAFVLFLLFMVRARPRSRERLEEGGGQQADYEA